ncbi:MAG: hypothetical protein R6U96_11825 [Promethearchaeia archaeon]
MKKKKEKAKKSKKKKKEKPKKKPKSMKRLMSIPEPREQALRAAGGGLAGVLSVVALTYILWGIMEDESILYAGFMLDTLSMGNGFNAFLGMWALSFTPFTSIGAILVNWQDNLLYVMIPILFSGCVIGITTKRLTTAILGGIFFIFWGFVLPILFVYLFSIFGVFDPVIVNATLAGILENPLNSWNYDWLLGIFNNLYITWSAAGALELGVLATVIALPFAGILQLIKR